MTERPANVPENTGWREDLENRFMLNTMRSIPFSLHDAMEADDGKKLDPRGHLRIENQGQMGSCQGHALTTGIEYLYRLARGEWKQLSRLHAYLGTQEIDGLLGRDAGSTISGGIKLSSNAGLFDESLMPYTDRYPSASWYRSEMQKGEIRLSDRIKSGSVFRIRSYEHAKAWVMSKAGFLHIGIPWGTKLDSQSRCLRFLPGQGGHAVCGMSFVDDVLDENDQPCLCIANSWGTNWGDKGYFYVGRSWLENAIANSRTVMIAVSDLSLPEPQRKSFIEDPYPYA